MRVVSCLSLLAMSVGLASCGHDVRAPLGRTTTAPFGGGVASAEAATLTPQLAAQRVWQPGDQEDPYDVSPDGRLVAFIDLSTGNLAVRDLEAGTNRDVTRKGTYDQSKDEAESAAFSRDGRQLAYEWFDSKTQEDELRVINVDGSGARTIFREPNVSVWPEDWTPDGKFVVTLLDDKIRRVALVPTSGGALRVVKTLAKWQRGLTVRVSPDGRYIAYTTPAAWNDDRRDMFLVSVADGRESPIAKHEADDYPVGWTRDGSQLVFASDRAGSPGVWLQRVTDGRAQGEPTLARGDLWHMGDGALRLTSNGRFFYSIRAGDRNVYTAAFDAGTGRLQSQPAPVTTHPGEDYQLPQWSPDGRYVAYITAEPKGSGLNNITIRSVTGEDVRVLHPRLPRMLQFAWIPHAPAMILNAQAENGRLAYFRFDLGTSVATPLVANAYSQAPVLSPDGRMMYYSPPRGSDSVPERLPERLIARDLSTGQERQVWAAPRGTQLAAHSVTSDGRTVIVVHHQAGQTGPRGVLAISTVSGAVTDLGETIPFDPAKQMMGAIGFTPDAQSVILMTRRTDNLDLFVFWRVPLAGGRAVRLPDLPRELVQSEGPQLSPDGRRIVFRAGKLQTEVWALDAAALRGGAPTPRSR
jgi:Tol biopolymer transport system component